MQCFLILCQCCVVVTAQRLRSNHLRFHPQHLPLALLPNATAVMQSVNNLVTHAIEGQINRMDLSLPMNDILNAVINGSEFPTLVPGQKAAVPTFVDDIYCNPAYFPNGCSTLDQVGKVFGVPIAEGFAGTVFHQIQRLVGDTLTELYTRVTRGITPPLVLYMQQTERLKGTVGSARSILQPIMTVSSDSKLWQTYTNLTSLLLWDLLNERVDVNDDTKLMKYYNKETSKNAFFCRMFNGRLPFCNSIGDSQNDADTTLFSLQPEPKLNISQTLDPQTGFRNEILIRGFEESCYRDVTQCMIGGQSIQPEQFDGIYKFRGVDTLGYPLYEKPSVEFSDFRGIQSLWLFVVAFQGPLFPQGITALITPNTPSVMGITLQSRNPFVIVAGAPPGCISASSFPLCLSNYNSPFNLTHSDFKSNISAIALSDEFGREAQDLTGWLLARALLASCPVPQDQNNGLCEIQVAVEIT